MDYIIVLVAVVTLCYWVYSRIAGKFSYWTDRGIPQVKPEFIFGNARGVSKNIHIAEKLQELYKELKGKHPLGGAYMFFKPIVVITDLDLLRNIFVKDFQYFHDRGTYYNERDDPLSAHLFNLEGEKWRKLRNKISPTFTSGKMKMMFPTIVAVGKQLSDYMLELTEQQQELELKDLLARYTTDVIGSCAFGIECNTLKNPDAKFREMGIKIFTLVRGRIKVIIRNTLPNLARFLRIRLIHPEVSNFFMNVIRETIDYRLKNQVKRNDFMDLMIKMKSDNDLKSDDESLTFNEIAAQSFVFFLAGFDTSSSLLTWTLYELSQNQDIQERGRRCLKEVLERHNGEFTYESVMEMKYLDQILNETLRKYPPISVHFRVAAKDYTVPSTNFVIPAGASLMIPVLAIHRDPQHFPDPDKFDPTRFTEEEAVKRHPYAFIPFGEGPRNCVAFRFGMMQARIGLAFLLSNFRFYLGAKTSSPMKFDVHIPILVPEGGLYLKVERLQ